MQPDFHQLEQYIHDALGLQARIAPWPAADRLPPYLRELYGYAQMELLGAPCLVVFDTNPVEPTPAAVRKHIDVLRSKQNVDVIYVRPQVTAYNRKRLIEQKVPFVVPGNQMYLPMLAIDLREHFRRVRAETPAFSPATQAVIIYALLHDVRDEIIPSDMARSLGYTPMTMTRAFDEIEAAGVGGVTMRGRERRLRFPATRQETWAKAQPFLRSPVKQRMLIPFGMPVTGPHAGLTALAHYSMLAPPTHPTLALSREQWKDARDRHGVVELPEGDPDAQEIQVWSYPPAVLARENTVDPLSLFLSLQGDTDERTQASLEEMMRSLKW